MQSRRTVTLGRLESGGTDPTTLRPLPDKLVDIRRTLGEFSNVGLQTQVVANVALRMHPEKVAIRRNFFLNHDWVYSYDSAGKKTLFRVITTQQFRDRDVDMVYLILTQDYDQRIIDGFELALGGTNGK